MAAKGRNVGNRIYLTENYYVLLGISPAASPAQIEKSFRKLAFSSHPDKTKGSEDRFLRLQEAKRILLDPEFRKEYDLNRVTNDIREAFLSGAQFLPTCHKISDDVRKDIEKWIGEFDNVLNLKDNWNESIGAIFQEHLLHDIVIGEDESLYCPVCDIRFSSEDDHYDSTLLPYISYVQDNVEPFIFPLLRRKFSLDDITNSYANSKDRKLYSLIADKLLDYQMKTLVEAFRDGHGREEEAKANLSSVLMQLEIVENEDYACASLISLVTGLFKDDPYSIRQGFISILKTFPSQFSTRFEIHEVLLSMLMKDDDYSLETYRQVLGAVHYVSSDWYPKFAAWRNKVFSRSLKAAILLWNFDQLGGILQLITVDTAHILQNFVDNQPLGYKSANMSGEYQAAILLLLSRIAQLEGDTLRSIQNYELTLEKAAKCSFATRRLIVKTVVSLLSDDIVLHSNVLLEIRQELTKVASSVSKLEVHNSNMVTPRFKLNKFATVELWEMQVPPISYRLATRNEEAIKERFDTTFDKALAYFDFSMGTGVSGKISCYLIAISHILNAMEATTNTALCYAYGKLVEKYLILCIFICRKFSGPYKLMYVYRFTISGLLEATNLLRQKLRTFKRIANVRSKALSEEVVPSTTKTLLTLSISGIENLARLYPLMLTPLQSVADEALIAYLSTEFMSSFIHSKILSGCNTSTFPAHLYSYYELDSIWRGWRNADITDTFEDARIRCMEDMLKAKNWNVSDVEDIMLWPMIERTEHGWMNNEEVELNFGSVPASEIFTACNGFELNLETGEFTLDLQPSDKTSPNLFCLSDIRDVFERGIYFGALTLEDPDPLLPSHPFQEFKYTPAALKGSDYLMTMLHADYLLKEITTGIEVNGLMPFDMRPSCDGFLQRLPEELQLKLRPLLERMRDPIDPLSENAHRFWISAEDVNTVISVSGGKMKMEFGSAEMRVNTKQIVRKINGVYEDDPEIKYTAENQLAQVLTEHYDEIGKYFQVLLRLKELSKLSLVYKTLAIKLESFENSVSDMNQYLSTKTINANSPVADIKEGIFATIDGYLKQTLESNPHPLNTWSNVESRYKKTLRLNNLEGKEHQLAPGERERVRGQITAALQAEDAQRFDHCASQIAGLYNIQKSTIRSYMTEWLNRDSSARNMIVEECLREKLRQEIGTLNRVVQTLRQSGITSITRGGSNLLENNGECSWVPATFCNKFKNAIDDEVIETENIEESNASNAEPSDDVQQRPTSIFKKFLNALPSSGSTDRKPAGSVKDLTIANTSTHKNRVAVLHSKEIQVSKTINKNVSMPSSSNPTGEEPACTTPKLERAVPTGIKPPRIYGGVIMQLGLNAVSLIPQVRAVRIGMGAVKAARATWTALRATRVFGTSSTTNSSRAGSNGGGGSSGRPPYSGGGGGNSNGGSGGRNSNGGSGGRNSNGGGRGGSPRGSLNGRGRGGDNSGTGGSKTSKTQAQSPPSTTYEAKVGPSGKPMRHFPRYSSRKEAKDAAALQGDKTKPEHNMPHKVGQPKHYHAVSGGKRIENGVHHTYGKGDVTAGRKDPPKTSK